jgi:signal transduction histidine kinase
MRYRDLSLKWKQIAALGLVLLIVASSSFHGLTRMQLMKNDIDEVSTFWLKRSETIGSLALNVALVRLNQVQMVATTDPARRQTYAQNSIARLDSVTADLDRLNRIRLDSLDRELDDTEQSFRIRETTILESLEDTWDTYLGELLFFLDPDEELDEETRARIFDASEDDFVAVAVLLRDLIDINDSAWQVSEKRADDNFRNAQFVTRFLFVGAILISIMIIGVLVRLITQPITELTRAARQVAAGDRSVQIAVKTKDEIGSLAKSFNRMTLALREQEAELLRQQAATEEKNEELEATLGKLQATQQQLIVREKMASLGQLTAGIAHEIKNPLNFVNNFARLSKDLAADLLEELKTNMSKTVEEALPDIEDLVSDLTFNADRIGEHGARADSIVRNMLLHSRGKPGEKVTTDINQLLDEYLNLSFHGMRAADSSFNADMVSNLDDKVGSLDVVSQNLGRVFLNIFNNAFYALSERSVAEEEGYQPTVTVSSVRNDDHIVIRIEDNGVGIPSDLVDKIFEPFFTTKPTGSGTGLGLSLAYDIVNKEHGGTMTVETEAGSGTTFVISLPA